MSSPDVILVNSSDEILGFIEKLEAHRLGLLHRAISVVVLNSKGELLLQKRAQNKYHSPGLWTNTCCSHPFPGEETKHAAHRRLKEEMGLSANLEFLFKFKYKTRFPNNLIEHELDHVFLCHTDEEPSLNPEEAVDWKYMSLSSVKSDIRRNPHHYTYWFKLIVERLQTVLQPA